MLFFSLPAREKKELFGELHFTILLIAAGDFSASPEHSSHEKEKKLARAIAR
jgi:hypothetical protein